MRQSLLPGLPSRKKVLVIAGKNYADTRFLHFVPLIFSEIVPVKFILHTTFSSIEAFAIRFIFIPPSIKYMHVLVSLIFSISVTCLYTSKMCSQLIRLAQYFKSLPCYTKYLKVYLFQKCVNKAVGAQVPLAPTQLFDY